MQATEFYDPINGAVKTVRQTLERYCERQPCSNPQSLADSEITRLTGWLPIVPFTTPEGMVAVGPMSIEIVDGVAHKTYATITIAEHEAQRAAWEIEESASIEAEWVAFAAAEIERKATPMVFDQPFEMPALVLSSQSQGLGVGVCATDDGDLVTFTYHASPVPEAAEIKRRIAQAVADHKARKQADKDERDTLKAQLAEARGKLATVEADSAKSKLDIEDLKKGKGK
jgi:hypothetical protein